MRAFGESSSRQSTRFSSISPGEGESPCEANASAPFSGVTRLECKARGIALSSSSPLIHASIEGAVPRCEVSGLNDGGRRLCTARSGALATEPLAAGAGKFAEVFEWARVCRASISVAYTHEAAGAATTNVKPTVCVEFPVHHRGAVPVLRPALRVREVRRSEQ